MSYQDNREASLIACHLKKLKHKGGGRTQNRGEWNNRIKIIQQDPKRRLKTDTLDYQLIPIADYFINNSLRIFPQCNSINFMQ